MRCSVGLCWAGAWAGALAWAAAAPAVAQPTIDGARDALYGPPAALQTVQTGFGNATQANGLGPGGELDAAYATVVGDRLYVLLAGNIENNFNKLSMFFDTRPGGENVLSAAPSYDYEGVSRNLGGLTFDAGFQADLHLYARWGSLTGSVFTVDIVDRAGGASPAVTGNGAPASAGQGSAVQHGVVTPVDLGLAPGPGGVGEARTLGGLLTQPLEFGLNNTNTAGVTGGSGAANQADAAAVATGFEFSIALADLGSPRPGQLIKLHAAYGNSNHNYHSNQVLGGLPAGAGNLGGNGAGASTGSLSGVNFNNFAGDQFFSIVVPGQPGDFNADLHVDAADYTTWRDGLGERFNPDDYTTWQNNFGAAPSTAAPPVPEPAAAPLALALGMVAGVWRRAPYFSP
ncbi:hypothetical protein Pla175_49600 [Pirellulimonas nuda]|uniref:PEP-CTERM protein-sorting domain-containing protein n=1 Tax=Pirellulimonas nuda TaxID=2528009 RepID=A0A518DJ69_9BACT|nr:hypothetical protein [Pirellulimonas nuda]QDU91531.1 hypothetical protein Pla175_49600 [Pirellulimonas nuda]